MSDTVVVTTPDAVPAVLAPTATDAIVAAQGYAAQCLRYQTSAASSAAAAATEAAAAAAAALAAQNAMAAFLTGLPTTLPSNPGQLWLNGGVVSVS